MSRGWKIGVGVVVAAAVAALGLWAFRGQLAVAAMERIFDRAMAGDPYSDLPDGLHVGLCGSGSPMPDPGRAGPCTVVLAGRQLFVIDAGSGGTKNLSLMNLPPGMVDAVLLTHLHSDHIDDLGELMLQRWAGGARTAPVPIYGPLGVDKVVAGFQDAYLIDRGFRIAHHGEKVTPPGGFGGIAHPFDAPRSGPDVVLIETPDLKVTAFPVEHAPVEPAVGYKFVYKGRSVVVSGDTAVSTRVEAAAKDVDVLVHEALAPNLVAIQNRAAAANGRANLAAITHDILSYHTAPEDAARIAQRSGARYLLLTHIIPPLPMRALEGPFLGDSRKLYSGALRVGHDGDLITLPAGGQEIRHSNRLTIFQ